MIPVPYLGKWRRPPRGRYGHRQDSNRLIALGSLGGFTYKLGDQCPADLNHQVRGVPHRWCDVGLDPPIRRGPQDVSASGGIGGRVQQ